MLVRGERYFALTLTPTIFPRSDEAVSIAVKLRLQTTAGVALKRYKVAPPE